MSQRVVFAWVWALVVCFLLLHIAYLWLGKRIAPDTDILALLPVQERDPVLEQAFTRMVDSAGRQHPSDDHVQEPRWLDPFAVHPVR